MKTSSDSRIRSKARIRDVLLACVSMAVGNPACGGSTEIGRTSPSDASTGATSSGGLQGTGGAGTGGSATGGVGGSNGGAPSSGGGAGAPGSGGGAGQANLCLGVDGQTRPELKRCSSDSDCTTLKIATCCGSDQVVGIHVGEHCTLPSIDCSGLGCAKFVFPIAEDRKTTESGGTIAVRCEFGDAGEGTCRSYIAIAVDAGTTACGNQTCTENQVCALPPNNGPPSPGPAFCVDVPAGCTSPLQCSCFAPDVCGGGALFCFSVTGHVMQCLFAP